MSQPNLFASGPASNTAPVTPPPAVWQRYDGRDDCGDCYDNQATATREHQPVPTRQRARVRLVGEAVSLLLCTPHAYERGYTGHPTRKGW